MTIVRFISADTDSYLQIAATNPPSNDSKNFFFLNTKLVSLETCDTTYSNLFLSFQVDAFSFNSTSYFHIMFLALRFQQ